MTKDRECPNAKRKCKKRKEEVETHHLYENMFIFFKTSLRLHSANSSSLEDLWGEDKDAEAIPNKSAQQSKSHETHDFPAELILGRAPMSFSKTLKDHLFDVFLTL